MSAFVPTSVLALGLITGLTYGLLAAGLVLVYRSSGVVNFAHGATGVFGASLLGLAAVRWHLPYWVALPVALAAGATLAAAAEFVVVRRLREAPRVMTIVATLGLAQFALSLAYGINSGLSGGTTFPQPSGMPTF